jgi:hypothetical protein
MSDVFYVNKHLANETRQANERVCEVKAPEGSVFRAGRFVRINDVKDLYYVVVNAKNRKKSEIFVYDNAMEKVRSVKVSDKIIVSLATSRYTCKCNMM